MAANPRQFERRRMIHREEREEAITPQSLALSVIAEATKRHVIQTTRHDPNHSVSWLPTRPDFAIRVLRSTSTSRGYHESFFEVVSRQTLDAADFEALSGIGLLGMGQAYSVDTQEEISDSVPPVTVDKRTGAALPDAPPVSYDGHPIVNMTTYAYTRYVIRRICDSGD